MFLSFSAPSYVSLMYLHLATVLPAVVLGAVVFIMKKGTPKHRLIGKIYMLCMMATAIIALGMPAHVGPRIFNHFGWIHSFCFLTIYSIPMSLYAIRKGNIRRHKTGMIMLYVGAILIAGGFTLAPGRYLHTLLFG